jgi:hypothetical protein
MVKKEKKEKKVSWEKKKLIIKNILKKERPTLTIQKPKDNPYVNRFFNEEWAEMEKFK